MMQPSTGELVLPDGVLEQEPARVRAAREVVEYLPVWMFFFYGCLLLNTSLTNLQPARPDLAHLAIFPLLVFVGFYAVRGLRAADVSNRAVMIGVTFALALALPLANLTWHQPSPLSHDGLLAAYELSNFAWAALMLWHASRKSRGHVWLFFGVGLVYGACLENGGILLGYFHETKLHLTMTPPLVAPWATMIGWCVVLYMATFAVWKLRVLIAPLRRSPVASGLLVATLATMLDLHIDPLATAVGCWIWDEGLPPFFHGVPLTNFVAWMCALFPFAWLMFREQQRAAIRDGGAWDKESLRRLLVRVPATLCVAFICFGTTMALLEGFDGPAWTVLYKLGDRVLPVLLAIVGL
jgi:uncharacterized membrane protein